MASGQSEDGGHFQQPASAIRLQTMTRSSGADGGAEMDYDDASPLLGKDEDVEMGVKRTAPGSVNGVDGEEDPLPPLPDTTWYKVRAFVHHSVEGTFDSCMYNSAAMCAIHTRVEKERDVC